MYGRLLLFDALGMRFRELRVEKDPSCPVCGDTPSVTRLIDYEEFCGVGEENPAPEVPEISPRELSESLDRILLVDVREPFEVDIARIPGAVLIPLGDLEQRFDEIDRERDVVVHCRSGKRSAFAVEFLMGRGFPRARNLRGGILAWTDEVDPSVPQY